MLEIKALNPYTCVQGSDAVPAVGITHGASIGSVCHWEKREVKAKGGLTAGRKNENEV